MLFANRCKTSELTQLFNIATYIYQEIKTLCLFFMPIVLIQSAKLRVNIAGSLISYQKIINYNVK